MQDDIFIGGRNTSDVLERLERMQQLFNHFKIKLNPRKTIYPESAAQFPGLPVLGHNVQTGGKISIPSHRQENIQERLLAFESKLKDRIQKQMVLYSEDIAVDVAGIRGTEERSCMRFH